MYFLNVNQGQDGGDRNQSSRNIYNAIGCDHPYSTGQRANYSSGNSINGGLFYSPSFLNASTYMISAAPDSLEFANSLATSFGNLGVTLGTAVGGWIIVTDGAEYSPWVTVIFGALAFTMMLLRRVLEQRVPAPSRNEGKEERV